MIEGVSTQDPFHYCPQRARLDHPPISHEFVMEFKKVSLMGNLEKFSSRIVELLRKVRAGEMSVSEARSRIESMIKECDEEEERAFLLGTLNSINDRQQVSLFYRAISSDEKLLGEYADRISSWFDDLGTPTQEEKLFVEIWGRILKCLSERG